MKPHPDPTPLSKASMSQARAPSQQQRQKQQQQQQQELDIPFPFQPYPAQKALMHQLYLTLDKGHVGIFESPTGTGKSLSLICASLYWLKERQRKDDAGEEDPVAVAKEKEKEAKSAAASTTTSTTATKPSFEPDWLRDYGKDKERAAEEEKRAMLRERRQALQQRLEEARKASEQGLGSSLRRPETAASLSSSSFSSADRTKTKQKKEQEDVLSSSNSSSGKKQQEPKEEEGEDSDADLLPAEYESGREDDGSSDSDSDSDGSISESNGNNTNKKKKKKHKGSSNSNNSSSGHGGQQQQKEDAEEEERKEELDRATTKILYCSRTHSQVSQYVVEIQKTAFHDEVRVISLSSRKNLCINDDVLKLGSDGRISDRCLDMQKGKTTTAAAITATTTAESGGAAAAAAESENDTKGGQKKKKRPHDTLLFPNKTKPKPKQPATKKCPFLPSDGGYQQGLYRDHALSQVRNLEDLAELGKKLGTCSYYGTRRAVAQAEVICMPYATLLHKGTRESMQIPLKGNVVLVDEAHNLIEAINAVHTSHLSLQAMSRALGQATLYWERYNARLSGKNAFYVQQIMRVLKGLVEYVRRKSQQQHSAGGGGGGEQQQQQQESSSSSIVMPLNELLFEAGMDNVNLFKLVRYMEQSQIAKKVLGFAERRLSPEVQLQPTASTSSTTSTEEQQFQQQQQEAGGDGTGEYVSNHVSSLQIVQSFLTTLTGSSQDGRIVLQLNRGGGTQQPKPGGGAAAAGGGGGGGGGRRRPPVGLKYIMLNAAVHFKEIVEEARSVVLVGGTMQPVAPIVSQLFPDLPAGHLDVFSCGHVIPPENLTVLCMSKGPTGVGFDFTHKSRALPEQMDELGRLLLNVCTVTPGGVVVFLPSYGYEEVVFRRWRETGLLSKLQAKKAIFNEPKRAKDVDAVLQAYTAAIAGGAGSGGGSGSGSASGGAVLFCVVGAKMSEGINFANEMARCVVMVGLPYPDSRDPELQQKLQYLDNLPKQQQQQHNSSSSSSNNKNVFGGGGAANVSGKSYYQNLCMRAVNQSIGRAIRHANDWAAIVLVDRRYFTDPSILPLLPKWIADRVVPYQQSAEFGAAFVHLSRFFRGKIATTTPATSATSGGGGGKSN